VTKVPVGNEKLCTELQNGMTLEPKKIDISETMDSCAKVHNVADNNIEKDESHQEEVDGDSSNKKR
jgi:hypothetical protein